MNNIHGVYLQAPVYEIMDRLGIDVGGGAIARFGLLFSCAVRSCQQCRYGAECREWLKSAPNVLDTAPEFCPNADIVFQLQFDGSPVRTATTAH
jgi:Family of unknown function (DUF6455)